MTPTVRYPASGSLQPGRAQLKAVSAVPIEQIARLVGHTGGSVVTETVYRKQLRPVINDGAVAMNELFPRADSYSPRATSSNRPGPELR